MHVLDPSLTWKHMSSNHCKRHSLPHASPWLSGLYNSVFQLWSLNSLFLSTLIKDRLEIEISRWSVDFGLFISPVINPHRGSKQQTRRGGVCLALCSLTPSFPSLGDCPRRDACSSCCTPRARWCGSTWPGSSMLSRPWQKVSHQRFFKENS